MLIKERMMGIYLAVFVHRDVRDFVRGVVRFLFLVQCFMMPCSLGFSKSAVTAGLIGGRVGNKGGVGISVNLDGATFLFVNAHLAGRFSEVFYIIAPDIRFSSSRRKSPQSSGQSRQDQGRC